MLPLANAFQVISTLPSSLQYSVYVQIVIVLIKSLQVNQPRAYYNLKMGFQLLYSEFSLLRPTPQWAYNMYFQNLTFFRKNTAASRHGVLRPCMESMHLDSLEGCVFLHLEGSSPIEHLW